MFSGAACAPCGSGRRILSFVGVLVTGPSVRSARFALCSHLELRFRRVSFGRTTRCIALPPRRCPMNHVPPSPPSVARNLSAAGVRVHVQVAAHISRNSQPPPPFEGHAFCFLPLPVNTLLPVHVNGFFELSSNRRAVLVRFDVGCLIFVAAARRSPGEGGAFSA